MTPQTNGVNFLEMSFYSGAAFIPDGDYAVYHDVMMHQATDKTTGTSKGAARLGVMISFYPLGSPTEESKLTQFYSMGTRAHESFAPNPETGKGIVMVAGAKGGGLNDSTNWSLYLASLFQSGLPQGIVTNDIAPLDGMWVHITNIEEPESRKSMKSNTAEVEQDNANRKPGKVAVVSEILEGGDPWNGGGGIPAATPVAAPVKAPAGRPAVVARPAVAGAPRPVAVAPKVNGAPRPPAPKPVAVVAPPPAESASDFEDLKAWANAGISDALTKKPNGMPRQTLRNEAFKYLQKLAGDDIAGQVVSNIFEVEDNFLIVLGELNYTVKGPAVVPAA